jgi:hypothetical protein
MNSDQKNDVQTQSYVELASRSYNLVVEAFSNANQRALNYTKALYDIASRPYASSALESVARENFDRANQIVELTVETVQQHGAETANFSKQVAAQTAAWQEQWMETARGLMRTGVSNLTYVKDTTDQEFQRFAARVDEMRQRAASTN